MASSQLDQVMRTKIDTACTTAEEFTKLYYESVDKKRHQMARLYMDNGILVWNGNGSSGKERIEKFFQELPRSEHTVSTLDAQPIVDESVSTQPTFLVQVSGTARFQDNPTKPFQQTFMITAEGDKWRIVSDCFRLQDGIF
ncbi:NTF2-related export protein [Anopheles bellator]|uniref:NTF2-related export protein n=1 Tax=Anopheles bellator TaxID=139047 RepID=UPI002648B80F|nr:NTF2-related export protein [Anopheles bellator]